TKMKKEEKNFLELLNLKEMQFNFINYDNNQNAILENEDQLIIQIDSLLKSGEKYGIIILDEFSNMINHLVTSSTLKNKRIKIFERIIDLCQISEKIIVLDANFNDNCLYYLEDILTNKKNVLYWNKGQNLNDTNVYFLEEKDFNILFHSHVQNNNNFIFASNEKRFIDEY